MISKDGRLEVLCRALVEREDKKSSRTSARKMTLNQIKEPKLVVFGCTNVQK